MSIVYESWEEFVDGDFVFLVVDRYCFVAIISIKVSLFWIPYI